MPRSFLLFVGAMALGGASSVLAADNVTFQQAGRIAILENAALRVEFNLDAGTYRAIDRRDGSTGFCDGCVQVENWASIQGSLRKTGSRLRSDRVGDRSPREAFWQAARGVGGGQGFLSGRGEVPGVGRATVPFISLCGTDFWARPAVCAILNAVCAFSNRVRPVFVYNEDKLGSRLSLA
jgi:hypothetical protein